MKAMIFAAGLGTRLRPLTNNKPKALVELGGFPLLEITIRRLKSFGFNELIINIHHFGDQILDFLKRKNNFDIHIEISDERDLLLDTGGGLKKAAWFLKNDPFLICNTDVLTDLDLNAFFNAHLKKEALATLAVRHRDSSRHLLFNEDLILSGWQHNRTGEQKICRPNQKMQPLAFSGIHALSPLIFDLMPDQAVFSIIDLYLDAGSKYNILAYPHDDTIWMDVGKFHEMDKAEKVFKTVGKF